MEKDENIYNPNIKYTEGEDISQYLEKRGFKKRTSKEIIAMNEDENHIWSQKDISDKSNYYVYGFKDCCVCSCCGLTCGEELNANYIGSSDKEKRLIIEAEKQKIKNTSKGR